jgi:Amt family ammonium transporter
MTDPSAAELARSLAETKAAMNVMWTLLAAFLVMFMQCGFALVESGLTRAKNVAHTMGMNFLVYAIGILGFWSVGFGLQMGGVGAIPSLGDAGTLSREFSVTIAGKEFGLFGTQGFFLSGASYTPAIAALFLFQMVFMDTAATIPTGAMAERWKFASFVLFSFVMSALIYPLYANWVWGGGFLSALGRHFGFGHGHVDFAGSSVVHMTGGVTAFVGAKLLGPRIGKYSETGQPRAIPAHSVALAVTGTFVLAFGWFGFNAGSTLSATDTRTAIAATNTLLASASGAFVATLYAWKRFGKPDVTWMCNGMLAGLVAITAPCAFVSAAAALLIGAVAGPLMIMVALFVEERLRVDDPVGAVGVHFANGLWGVLALGLFANGEYGEGLNGVAGGVRGLLYGDAGQLVAQSIGAATNVVFVGLATTLTFILLDRIVGNRVAPADELDGLDLSEMGIEGYSPEYRGVVSTQIAGR